MYLKRLEIQGFKSFADKVEFEFPSGITAIVGPNGSGKSNVVDSIRWVLGEQSVKSLRGSKMEDVIFSGSADRRPLGMAQVSLTLDNSDRIFNLDFEEITVSRRLYRSGESEYLINKAPSRLKDIQELFMDTGLGREGLSIISQGKVDEILSLKPEDRRGLIEEAAGIIKYKYRKKEAERKLAETEEHLIRVEDIIQELEERVEPLEEQATKAKEYRAGKEELDQLELSVEVHDITCNQVREKQLLTEKQQLEDSMTEQMTDLTQQEAELAQKRLQSQQQETMFQEQQQCFYNLQNQLERRTNQIQIDQQFVKNTAEQQERLEVEFQTQNAELQMLEQRLSSKKQQTGEAEAFFQKQNQTVLEQEKALQQIEEMHADLEQEQELCNRTIFTNMQQQAHNHNALQRLEDELSGGDRGREKLERKILQLEEQLQKQQTEREIVGIHLEQEEKKQKQNQIAISKLEQEVEQRKREQFLMRQQLNAIQLQLQEQQSKANALKELEESGEGYQYGVKSILEQKQHKKLSGIIGTVSQLITVPQHLEKAIETTMGSSLQNLVTEDDKQAQSAIRYLKEQKKGRATFLPLNTIKGQRAEEELGKENGVLGLAVDLIQFDNRYEKIMLHLLGRVWIVDTLVNAVAIGKKHGFNYRMVTLDGELVVIGGALTGGNHEKERGGLLARQRQIADLEVRVAELTEQLTCKNQELDVYYAVTDTKKQQMAELRNQNETLIRTLAQLNQQFTQYQTEEKRLQKEFQIETFQLEEQQKQLVQQKKQLEQETQRKLELAEEEVRLKEKGEQLKTQLQAIQQDQKKLQIVHNQDEIALATAQQRLELLEQQMKEEQLRFTGLQQIIKQRELESVQLIERQNQYKKQIAENETKVIQERDELAGYQQQLVRSKESRQQLQMQIERLEKQIKEKRQSSDKLREQNYQLNLQLNKVQGYLSSGHRRLLQNFLCTYEEAQKQAVKLENIPQTQKEIQKLKEKLQQLGEINFTAIEEYEQVTQRLTFLRGQITDLQEARHSLNRVIQEMEKIMAQKFSETYKDVNVRFSEVFTSMFGGGQAHLELSDPEDYLLTGIEIVAQPPGKKEQVLTLLSGGERAMTAIALLFSLLTVKPSPFCILDEIESALDDANIDRFAKFVQEYAEKTQFIMISHRKGTMEAADVLYGVAMENKGVSRLMSVNISDYDS